MPESVRNVVHVTPCNAPLDTATLARGDVTDSLLPLMSRCQVAFYYLPGNEREAMEAVLAMQRACVPQGNLPPLPSQKVRSGGPRMIIFIRLVFTSSFDMGSTSMIGNWRKQRLEMLPALKSRR